MTEKDQHLRVSRRWKLQVFLKYLYPCRYVSHMIVVWIVFVYYIWDFITTQSLSIVMILIYYMHHSDSFWNSVCRVWGAVQILPYHSTMCLQVKCTYWNISYITCGHMEFLTVLNPHNYQPSQQNLHLVGSTIQQERRRRLTRPK